MSIEEVKRAMIEDWEKYGYCPKYDEYCPCGRYKDYIEGFFGRQFGGWANEKRNYDITSGKG